MSNLGCFSATFIGQHPHVMAFGSQKRSPGPECLSMDETSYWEHNQKRVLG